MISTRRAAIMAGLLALAAISMTPAYAKSPPTPPQPFDGHQPRPNTFLQQNSDHQLLENELRNGGWVQLTPGRWLNHGFEIDLPPAEQLTPTAVAQLNERLMEISRDQHRQMSGGSRDCAHPGDTEDETEGGCR